MLDINENGANQVIMAIKMVDSQFLLFSSEILKNEQTNDC